MTYKKQLTLAVILTALITFLSTSAFFLFTNGLSAFLTEGSAGAGDPEAVGQAKMGYVKALLEREYIGDLDKEKMYNMAVKGMAESTGDPYTVYYTKEEFERYMDATTGSYVGVGIILSSNPDTNQLVVVAPYDKSPGAKAGVLPGDVILKVDGDAVDGSMLDEAAHRMRGEDLEKPEGTQVTLTLMRDGGEPFDVVLTREQIDVTTVSSKMLDGGIAQVRVSNFDSDTDKEFQQEINKLKGEGMKEMVLDLRDNPGGDFDVACRFADQLLDEGVITYSEDKNGEKQYHNSDKEALDVPVVVLINGGSASSSEVVTGALKDRDRAKVVGTKSFGKGIVQGVYKIPQGGGMSVTIQRYYTPNGVCIHGVGIEPDVTVNLPEDLKKLSAQLTYEEDLQLQKAVELLNQ